MEQFCQKALIDVDHIIHIHEGKLHVDLGKLRLTVCPQVLVPEAFCKLEIAVASGAHEKLLEKLGRLRQRVEMPVVDTAWHKVIPGSLRCASHKNRRLDLKKSLFCKELAGQCGHLASHQQVSLHVRSAQIQIAVFKTHFFFCL